ncbi:hypothetical protein B0O80DRAFT_435724 [Mortierella sp. GBAus27b]|nr:hypothetical protein B0O80DRAFT_435724 [Mortierella sp. GBAus27b]
MVILLAPLFVGVYTLCRNPPAPCHQVNWSIGRAATCNLRQKGCDGMEAHASYQLTYLSSSKRTRLSQGTGKLLEKRR